MAEVLLVACLHRLEFEFLPDFNNAQQRSSCSYEVSNLLGKYPCDVLCELKESISLLGSVYDIPNVDNYSPCASFLQQRWQIYRYDEAHHAAAEAYARGSACRLVHRYIKRNV